jgi:Tfp pilus assembly protein PilE
MKKQNGLTIIKLMVLLLIAGIAGSMLINALIKHRCLTAADAHMCMEKSSIDVTAPQYALLMQQPE